LASLNSISRKVFKVGSGTFSERTILCFYVL
jgi:hypothetical protein